MRILAAMLILLAAVPARAGTTVRYTVLFQGKPGGTQVTTVADDGTVTVDYRCTFELVVGTVEDGGPRIIWNDATSRRY